MEHNHHKSKHHSGAHQGHSTAMFRNKFYISLILTVPVLALSPLIQQFLGFSLAFQGDVYVLFALATAVFFYGGRPFLSGAGSELKRRNPGMMTLIALAIIVAYVYSSAVVFGLAGKFFFWELVTLIDIMLLGHWIEMRSVMGASTALEKLYELIPDNAHLLESGKAREVPTGELEDGNIVLVKPGEKVPADGVARKGESYVNESMVTGESRPVAKREGDKVIGGSINTEGALEVEVSGTGGDSYLSRVISLVKQAQAGKSRTQALADKAAFWLTVVALISGMATLAGWLLAGSGAVFAIERMATVLVITCPHALGLAIPLVVAVSTTQSAQNGLLVRNRTAFESARKITAVVFDKTGTLTDGSFGVKDITLLDGNYDKDGFLALFAALEQNSEHPIGQAIVKKVQEKNIKIPQVEDFQAVKGKGVKGKISGQEYIAAGPGYVKELGLPLPGDEKETGGTRVYLVGYSNSSLELVGAIDLSDAIREESYAALKALEQAGIKSWLITGDNEKAAKYVSDELGMAGYFSGVLPDEKQNKVKQLQAKGEFIAMVGDGINDAPALAQSNVGIAIGSGTDIAAETADIILVNSDPRDVSRLVRFGRATYRKMMQNLFWAAGYNIVAIPLAAGVLAGVGILLSPAVGAVLMSFSTIIVAINAKLLKFE